MNLFVKNDKYRDFHFEIIPRCPFRQFDNMQQSVSPFISGIIYLTENNKMTEYLRRKPEILNPRYAGATPEMVARALVRWNDDWGSRDSETELSRESDADGEFQSSI